MHVDGLVEDYVLDFALGLADDMAQLVVVEEKELKFYSLVLEKLHIVSPISVIFRCHFQQRSKGFYL